METGAGSTNAEGFLSRMALNDNKAGMEGLDRDKINKIIMETSKGSRYYENELKREQQVNRRIEKMMLQKAQITPQQLKKAQAEVDRVASMLDRSRDLSRVVVHVDMDAFYAAVEMRDCPELKDKPMAVGCMSMLSTSNYHARKFGVRAAMPGFIAKKLCPSLIIVPTNFEKYRAVSSEIREIFADYDPHFQPLSLDEAYLDFTDHLEQRQRWPESARTHRYRSKTITTGEECPQEAEPEEKDLSPVLFEDSPSSSPSLPGSAGVSAAPASEVFGTSVEEAVREMRFRIEQKTTLTASAGIAPNMMLAKVCSDKNKPNGQYRLPATREAVMDFIQTLPVRKVCGIGKVSEKMFKALGVSDCAHLGQQMALLSLLFSETSWHHFLAVSLGLGSTHVPRTFKELSKPEEQLSLCRELCEDLAADLNKEGLKGKTVTLKLKNVKFEVKTRAQTLPCAVATEEEIFAIAKDLLKVEIENASPQPLRLRLMGVRISAFVGSDDKKQMQKSIIGFLQPGKSDCGGESHGGHPNLVKEDPSLQTLPAATQARQRLGEAPRWSKQRRVGEAPLQSFFQRAQAKRLELQAAKAEAKEEGDGEGASASAVATAREAVESPVKADGDDDLSDDDFVSPVVASTSGCGGRRSEALTCPVCFRQVETTDLNIFNRHIDHCLSDGASRPKQRSVVDSESDVDLESGATEGEEVDRAGQHKVGPEESKNSKDLGRIQEDQQSQERSEPPPKGLTPNGLDRTRRSPQPRLRDDEGPVFVCPVCQLTQDTDSLAVFNRHVDLCLNQEVLHELRGQRTSSKNPPVAQHQINNRVAGGDLLLKHVGRGKSKRRDSPSSPPCKKAKSVRPCNTIDKFFR